jgi:hypothetical protein
MMSFSARGAAQDSYTYESLPKSGYQMVITSRTTAAADDGGGRLLLLGVGLMASVVVFLGGSLLAMNGGAKVLKEFRLTRRAQRRSSRAPAAPGRLPALPSLYEDTP